MSVSAGPDLTENGLVFYYDMANDKKSWKGAPITNLVSNASTMSGWNNYSNGPAAPYITDLGTTGWYMNNAGSWNGCYRGISGITPGTYTFSCWAKYLGGHPNQTGGSVYISGWGGSDTAVYINKNISGWQRIQHTLNVTTTSLTFYLISWGGTNNSDNSSWQVTMPQMEAGSFATPFVDGTRSNTQAIVDLTGKNTVTANSVTYDSDGTFRFYGANYLDASILQFNLYNLDIWLYNDYVIPGNDGAIGGVVSSYQSPINFNRTTTQGVNLGGWTGSASNESVHIWGNTSTGGGYTGMTYIRDQIPIGWHNFQFNWNGSTYDIWIDGVKKTTYALNGTSHAPLHPVNAIRIGGDVGSSYYFVGKIPVVKCYSSQLSDSQVKQNFNALRGRYGI